jgi:hypothetical protein
MKTPKVISLLVAIFAAVVFMPRADAACPSFQMDQDIQARWQQDFAGAIGCPVANQGPTQDRKGVQVAFQYGWIIKPNNHYMGSNFLLIAQFFPNYNPNPRKINLWWGSSAPFSYDKWLLRLDIYGGPNLIQLDLGGGNSGQYSLEDLDVAKTYQIIVEGCDNGTFGSTCRQDWSPAAIIQIAHPNGSGPPPPPPPPPASCPMTITSSVSGKGTETVIDVKGQGFAKSHSAWARVTDVSPGSPSYGSSNYSSQVQTDAGGGLSLKMAQPCKTGVHMDVAASDGTENPQASFNVCWSNVVALICQ